MGKILSSISLIALTIINYLQVGKFKQRGVSIPSTLKVVPVAVMLTMSLMVAQAQNKTQQSESTITQQPSKSNKIDGYDTSNWKIVCIQQYDKASPLYGNCTINYISNDGNDADPELAILEFSKEDPVNKDKASATLIPEKFVKDKDLGWCIEGQGSESLYLESYGFNYSKKNDKVRVDLYDYFLRILLNIYENELPIIDETQNK